MACEKCWGDAYLRMLMNGRAQSDNYQELLRERADNPCSEIEQRGAAIADGAQLNQRRMNMENGQTQVQMPQYQSHKKVWALKIKEVTDPTIPGNETDGSRLLHFYEKGYAPRQVHRDYVRKHDPKPEGYFVVYSDGYESWSPAEAFESGYVRI